MVNINGLLAYFINHPWHNIDLQPKNNKCQNMLFKVFQSHFSLCGSSSLKKMCKLSTYLLIFKPPIKIIIKYINLTYVYSMLHFFATSYSFLISASIIVLNSHLLLLFKYHFLKLRYKKLSENLSYVLVFFFS